MESLPEQTTWAPDWSVSSAPCGGSSEIPRSRRRHPAASGRNWTTRSTGNGDATCRRRWIGQLGYAVTSRAEDPTDTRDQRPDRSLRLVSRAHLPVSCPATSRRVLPRRPILRRDGREIDFAELSDHKPCRAAALTRPVQADTTNRLDERRRGLIDGPFVPGSRIDGTSRPTRRVVPDGVDVPSRVGRFQVRRERTERERRASDVHGPERCRRSFSPKHEQGGDGAPRRGSPRRHLPRSLRSRALGPRPVFRSRPDASARISARPAISNSSGSPMEPGRLPHRRRGCPLNLSSEMAIRHTPRIGEGLAPGSRRDPPSPNSSGSPWSPVGCRTGGEGVRLTSLGEMADLPVWHTPWHARSPRGRRRQAARWRGEVSASDRGEVGQDRTRTAGDRLKRPANRDSRAAGDSGTVDIAR